MARDGQVYFVYNRVESIQGMAKYISELVPECKVGIIHGQMTEKELESEMIKFMQREYDVLVCTTIIETGIDIQNSNKIAYAYFMYTKDKVLTEVAEKRLKALKDFTELGSGFKIAMRDLEIRGAGNMMGSSQHGHMAAIGYDLYCRMLEDTVKLIKGEIEQEPIETTVDIKVDAYIPSSYIEDEIQKIEVYKKIAAIENMDDYKDIKDELEDRYSSIPEAVYNLMDIAYVKSLAKVLLIEEIKETPKEVRFKFPKGYKKVNDIYHILMKKYKENVVLYFGETPFFAVKVNSIKREEILDFYKKLLTDLIKNSRKK